MVEIEVASAVGLIAAVQPTEEQMDPNDWYCEGSVLDRTSSSHCEKVEFAFDVHKIIIGPISRTEDVAQHARPDPRAHRCLPTMEINFEQSLQELSCSFCLICELSDW